MLIKNNEVGTYNLYIDNIPTYKVDKMRKKKIKITKEF